MLVIQRKFSVYKPAEIGVEISQLPISIVICARNESKNLAKNLPAILNQKYPDFQVVVVNDCSVDDSEDVLRVFEYQYQHLKVVKIKEHPRHKTGKKFAATLGIKAAENEILLFTDADCNPESENWISMMCRHYQNPSTEIVLGYSPYTKKRGLLNALIRYETFQTALNYFSYTLSGMPYMGVGRNLSYKKSTFFKGKGFAAHMHLKSGDDDLFVNQNATEYNVALEVDPQTHMWTEPKVTWSTYWQQKARHLSASHMYKLAHKTNLSLQAISAMGFYLFLLVCLILKVEMIAVGIVFALRFLIQILVYYKPFKKLRNKDLGWWLLILDPFYYIYLMTVSIAGIFTKKVVWK